MMVSWKKAVVFTYLNTLKVSMLKHRIFLAGTILEYIIIALLFTALTLFYTDFVLLEGTHKLFIEGPGDGTAGFLWLNFADRDWIPFFGHTDLVNYPTGETLSNPTFITYSALLAPLWVLTKLFGAIMALNLVTFFGFFGCAMLMYWLIKRLTGNIAVAIFAGYAAAFVPYHIMKSSSHLAYIFSLVFVLIFAAFIGFWNKPTVKRAVILAATVALAFYTDGYYLLIASIFVACLVVSGFIYSLIARDGLRFILKRIKYLVLTVIALIVLMLPVAYVQLSQGNDIKNSLGRVRDNIAFEIEYYAARPSDFIIPSVHNPFLMNSTEFQQIQKLKNSRSNTSENTLYVGFVLIVLCLIGLIVAAVYIFARKHATLRKLSDRERRHFLLATTIFIVSIPVLYFWTLPPHISIFGQNIITPSGLLIHFNIALWRVMARFFLPLHVIIVVFASLSLAVLFKVMHNMKWGRLISIGVVVVTMLLLSVEYASMTSRPAYDFNKIPAAYTWLRDQKDIQVVAELPLLDKPLDVNYNFATAQIIHGKKLINTHLANNEVGGRTALGDDDEGEAVDYAIARGAQAIITHDANCQSVKWGEIVYKDSKQAQYKEGQYYGDMTCIYRVNPSQHPDNLFVTLTPGTFADAPVLSPDSHEYSVIYGGRGELRIRDQLNKPVSGSAVLSANISTAPHAAKFNGTWQIVQGDTTIASGAVGEAIYSRIDASLPVVVKVTDAQGQDPLLYQIALSNIVVTGQ